MHAKRLHTLPTGPSPATSGTGSNAQGDGVTPTVPGSYRNCCRSATMISRLTQASWNDAMGEFILPYEHVRSARNPARMLLEFAQSTYEAAAGTAGWDRDKPRTQPSERFGRTMNKPACLANHAIIVAFVHAQMLRDGDRSRAPWFRARLRTNGMRRRDGGVRRIGRSGPGRRP